MAIKIIQDKTSKKKKTIKKVAKRKSKNSYTTRHTDMAMSYGTIRLSGRTNRKKKSNGKVFRKIIMLIFIVCLAFSSVYAYNHLMSYLCTLERFFVDSIEITGCKNVTKSEIMNILPFKVGESSFAIGLRQAEKTFKKNKSELKDVSMSRQNWGKKIVVSLTEREPEVFVNIDDKSFGLDFDNKPFNLRGNMSDMQIPTLIFNSDEERANLLTFYKNIKRYISNIVPEITEIKYGEVEDVILKMNNKTNIYWGLPKENKLENKATKLHVILNDLSKKKKEAKSIDLSFIDENENKVIVDLFPEENNV